MARTGSVTVTNTQQQILANDTDNRTGIIITHVSGDQVTLAWGNGITVTAGEGILLDTTLRAIALEASPMYQEELHAICASGSAVLTYHLIGSSLASSS